MNHVITYKSSHQEMRDEFQKKFKKILSNEGKLIYEKNIEKTFKGSFFSNFRTDYGNSLYYFRNKNV